MTNNPYPTIKELLLNVLYCVVAFGFVILVLFTLVEWAAGCGETYTDSKGRTHLNECIFINLKEQSND